MYEWTTQRRGSVSAEHGIGQMKVGALHFSKSAPAIAVMQQMKRALDPKVWAGSVGWDVWAAGVGNKVWHCESACRALTPGLGEEATLFPPPAPSGAP